eukprot:4847912-Amphidinium_carterae.1
MTQKLGGLENRSSSTWIGALSPWVALEVSTSDETACQVVNPSLKSTTSSTVRSTDCQLCGGKFVHASCNRERAKVQSTAPVEVILRNRMMMQKWNMSSAYVERIVDFVTLYSYEFVRMKLACVDGKVADYDHGSKARPSVCSRRSVIWNVSCDHSEILGSVTNYKNVVTVAHNATEK